MFSLLVLLQAAAPPASALEWIDYDLRHAPASDDSGDDVVVTARRTDPRLPILPQRAEEPLLPRAEMGLIGKARAAVRVDQQSVGGAPSNRAMVSITLPF